MLVRFGIENGVEGRSIAWALNHPGCFAYGRDHQAAVEAAPAAVAEYAGWIARHNDGHSWLDPQQAELRVEETWNTIYVNEEYELEAGGYEINAWFLHDWKPLAVDEIERGMRLLAWSRTDLLGCAAGLSAEQMEQPHPGERWNIHGLLKHVGGAEWWYLDRIGLAFPQAELPKDPFDRLEVVRSRFVEVLQGFAGFRLVVGTDAEFWSPRKLLRRALWHERDHTQHIRKLLSSEHE